jgi:hypothetical protein
MAASERAASVHNVWLLVERLLEHGVSVELAIEAPSSIVASARPWLHGRRRCRACHDRQPMRKTG